MSVHIVLDPGVPVRPPMVGPEPDPRSPGFRDLEEKAVAEFRRLAASYLAARGRRPVVTLPGSPAIRLDGSLFGRLALAYAADGWTGVEEIRDNLLDLLKSGAAKGPDGAFFATARDLLRLLVERTLIDLETRAAELAGAALKASGEALDRGKKQLRFHTDTYERVGQRADDLNTDPVVVHRVDNHELCGRLHAQLVKVAREFVAVAAFQRHLDVVRDPAGREADDLRASVEAYAGRAGRLMKAPLFTKECPLGLLGIRLVDIDTTQETFEHRLAQVLALLTTSVTAARKYTLGARAPGVIGPGAAPTRVGKDPTPYDFTPAPELRLLTAAAAGVEKDPAWLPLLHEETWDRMLDEPGLVQGAFGYVVASRYRLALLERKKADEAEAASKRTFWRFVEIVAAGLSIAALLLFPWGAVPLLALVESGLAAGAAAAALVVGAHQIGELYAQVALSERLLVSRLMVGGAAAQGAEVLSRLGAVAQFRLTVYGEALKGVSLVVLGELVGMRLAAARYAVRGYGYAQDLRTLLGPAR
ncbi:hypothetical protein ACTWJ8_29365 [Streptomyces sp. SDT5-1]|uniref:hypothetical protein n=1 Tax=Streptomyces sp. SDT5-1 TaxID=3406418 RepID=UPI003FCFF2F1